MFVVPKEGCQTAIENASKESYQETAKKKVVSIEVADLSPRDCVIEAIFEKPGTSEFDSLNVSVNHASSSAQDKAIPSGLDQPMHITAHANEIKGGEISTSENLYYKWDVFCDEEMTTPRTNEIEGISKTEGMNLPSLDLTANFPDDCTESVTVTTQINEPTTGGGSNFGKSETTFQIYNVAESPLKTYKTQIAEETKFEKTNTPVCDQGDDKTLCRVMNNEVIAVTATCEVGSSDYCKDEGDKEIDEEGNEIPVGRYDGTMLSWTVDGEAYNCDSSISPNCNDRTNSGSIVVPMKGNSGDTIVVTAHINDVDSEKNNSQTISRMFRITQPEVSITPVSGAVRKVLGTYEDLDDNEFLKESQNTLEAIEGEEITLQASIYPSFLHTDDTVYTWTIDGKEYDNKRTMTFVNEGDVDVSVTSEIGESIEKRIALEEGLGITQSQTIPTTLSASVELNTIDKTEIANAKGGFFATVSHNTPQYLLFILKMTLVMGIMIFIPSLILGIKMQK